MIDGWRLRKHHGLGNDFLVLVDGDGTRPIDPAMAVALCDRHRGVGADGLIRATPAVPGTGAEVVMELLNADGSRAETSGNGLRCLAQAVALDGLVTTPEFTVLTDAGPRLARVGPTAADGAALVAVGMGRAVLGPEGAAADASRRSRAVDLGNPHLVIEVPDPAAVDLASEGAAEEARHPGGVNVTYAALTGPDALTVRTWERGAGQTQACGSGSCAAAAALRAWGLVGPVVEVDNPGGRLTVGFEAEEVVLTGPVQFVAVAEVTSKLW